ncbi:MAG: hypothetical protein H0U66_01935 [Gemmatimonadaceae bacterium]|nr:hypothetical protein [Gemmatimonadaceae bacterium]
MRTDANETECTAITERPAPQYWRCDGEENEPLPFATLLAATVEPPRTPEAMIAGGGVVLAEADHDCAVWVYSAAGMRQLDAEMALTAERDSDVALSMILAVDFAIDMSRSA